MNTETSLHFRVRPAGEADLGYVIDHWRNNALSLVLGRYRLTDADGREEYRRIREVQTGRIRKILASPETAVTVAHLTGDRETLVGFCARSATRIHYVYVASTARWLGIGRALIGDVASVRAFDTERP